MRCLDSDVLIAFLKGEEDAVKYIEQLDAPCTTIINVQEVLFGVADVDKVLPFFEVLTILPYDSASVRHVVALKKELHGSGNQIGAFDEIIAGICLANTVSLVTRNTKHFTRVRDLRVETC